MEHASAALLRRLNPFCARALEAAASLCQIRAHAEILPEHWLLKLLEQEKGTSRSSRVATSGTWMTSGRIC